MNTLPFMLHAYFVVALLYNVFSQIWLDAFKRPWAPTDPKTGIMTVSVVYLTFLLETTIGRASQIFLLILFTALILRFGVVHHIMNYKPSDYLSRLTWLLAIGINIYGVVIMTLYIL